MPAESTPKPDYRFRWTERLHRSAEFDRVYEEGQRFQLRGLTLWVRRDPSAVQCRLGLAISRRYGNAVARNRLKRLLREVFRLHKAELPRGVELVFSARPLGPRIRLQTIQPLVSSLWMKASLIKLPLGSPAPLSDSTSC